MAERVRASPADGSDRSSASAADGSPVDLGATPGPSTDGQPTGIGRPSRVPWWRTRRGWVFAVLLVGFVVQMVTTAARTQLADERELAVTLAQTVTIEQREELRTSCGSLPGVSVVEDRGRADLVRRFPARFSLSGASDREVSGLFQCLERYPELVVGSKLEGQA